jgi:Domain of unknown function (DUF4397)
MTGKLTFKAGVGLALVAAALVLAACGGGTDRTKARVRLVNATSAYDKLDLGVDGTLRQGAVVYGDAAGYFEVDPGKTASTLSTPNSPTVLLSFTPDLSKDKYYSLLAYGALGALKQVLLDDNAGALDNNKTLLRVVNAAPDAGALDVYLTGSSDLLSASVPVATGAALGTVGAWLTVNSGTWRLRVAAAGSRTDLRLDLAAQVLSSKQLLTLVLTPGRGGVLVNALLLTQQADIQRQDNGQARVRAVAGLADAAAVSVRVGASSPPLLNSTASPAVGLYSLVNAGAQNVAVSVAGQDLATPSFTLIPGADYTLLVRGTPGAGQVNWIEDDNRLASDSSQARLRLLNGLAGTGLPLSLTVDLVPIASNVQAGSASSDYANVAPTTTAKLVVTSPGLSKPFEAVDQSFVAGANYTLFLLGSPTAATGALRKDR